MMSFIVSSKQTRQTRNTNNYASNIL